MIVHSPKDLALVVSHQRKKQKLSQTAISTAVGLKQKTISAFENRPESTKLETLFYILSAAGLELSVSEKGAPRHEEKWSEEW